VTAGREDNDEQDDDDDEDDEKNDDDDDDDDNDGRKSSDGVGAAMVSGSQKLGKALAGRINKQAAAVKAKAEAEALAQEEVKRDVDEGQHLFLHCLVLAMLLFSFA
jgi:hypothetical protein